jgi:hypothetical protein
MKELPELKTTYIECDCRTHLLQLTFDDWEESLELSGNDDLRFLYISFYNWE